jgi:hypothetical protein
VQGALVAAALLCASQTYGGACVPLPSRDLQPLDHQADGYPDRGVVEADRMINEVIVFERAADRPAQAATTLYLRGQIRIEAGEYAEARSVLQESRHLAEDAGDNFGAIFTDVALCPALMLGYRARLLGGSFLIEPGPEHGWRIVIAVPMA